MKDFNIPIYHKCLLTIPEACAYTNIGERKMRDLAKNKSNGITLMNGTNILIKRIALEEYLSKTSEI